MTTTRRLAFGGSLVTALAAPAVLRAQEKRSWRMVTSWPRNLPGPGVNAQRLADRITAASGGRISVTLHAAGEIVPALQVFDAVAGGAADLGHTASFYWTGKARAAVFFTTVPFGLTPLEHIAWIEHGGGQGLWDELYAPLGVKAFMAGSSGMQMGGWFKREIKSKADLQGLKLRAAGLAGDLFRALGATTLVLGVPDIYPALQSGTIDGVEFLGPSSDRAQGYYQQARFYYWPSFTKPNGTAECLIAKRVWDGLPPDLQRVVADACAVENQLTLSESDWRNAQALEALVKENGVILRPWPRDLVDAAAVEAETLLKAFDAEAGVTQRIGRSYAEARQRLAGWSRVGARAFLEARDRA